MTPFRTAQKDEPWHKVVLHGIPTADFNTPNGIALVTEEIQTFNKGLQPIGTPYWLTQASKRLNQRAGSVVVAFASPEEANRAIRHRLYIAGTSVSREAILYSSFNPMSEMPRLRPPRQLLQADPNLQAI